MCDDNHVEEDVDPALIWYVPVEASSDLPYNMHFELCVSIPFFCQFSPLSAIKIFPEFSICARTQYFFKSIRDQSALYSKIIDTASQYRSDDESLQGEAWVNVYILNVLLFIYKC